MAHKTEKEETEFKVVPETIMLCINCGVAGNCAANNLCQKCLASSTSTSAAAGASSTSTGAAAKAMNKVFVDKSFRSISTRRSSFERNSSLAETSRDLKKESAIPAKREVNRCSGCRRKVGLTGFRCRCGEMFCADHRYSDRHDCSYDYKTAGRETIARENPVVKAAKIIKI